MAARPVLSETEVGLVRVALGMAATSFERQSKRLSVPAAADAVLHMARAMADLKAKLDAADVS